MRIGLAPFTGHPYDLQIWIQTGEHVALGYSPYEAPSHIAYPPLWALWCGLSYVLSKSILPGNLFGYIFLLKLPIIAGDIAVAGTLVSSPILTSNATHRISDGSQVTLARLLAVLFLFNPFTITAGTVWGMMDNLAALSVVLGALQLAKGKYVWAGIFAMLAIDLKLYPVVFLPAFLTYIWKRRGSLADLLSFLLSLNIVVLLTITAPFLLFGWNRAGLLEVLGTQTSRTAGGISPLGVLAFLPNAGIQSIGPFRIEMLTQNLSLKFVWVVAVALATVFLILAYSSSSFPIVIEGFLLTYLSYVLTAPWVSEQSIQTLLILMLFQIASKRPDRGKLFSYGILSVITFTFISLNVPLTSFLFPIVRIDIAPLAKIGVVAIPWLTLAFTCVAAVETVWVGVNIKSVKAV